jgi:hypothetical protein
MPAETVAALQRALAAGLPDPVRARGTRLLAEAGYRPATRALRQVDLWAPRSA